MELQQLSDLLKDVPAEGGEALAALVSDVTYRSDLVRASDAFFCIRGLVHDGHSFASQAASRGASALVVDRLLPDIKLPQAQVTDTRKALAWASARLFGMPSERLEVVGITGTNGKTTTCSLMESIARTAGSRTGVIGTVATRIEDDILPADRTTPESRDLQELLARMADRGVRTVAMEVSSHAIDLKRADAVSFAVAAFTNLSQDHLDYHGTIEEYFAVKSRLFTEMPVRSRVVCIDDEWGANLAASTGAEWTVGRRPNAAVRAEDVRLEPTSSHFRLTSPAGEADVRLPLAGEFNVSNALVAAGCAFALGLGLEEVVAGLERAGQVPGRLERIDEGQPFTVLVDYAHTPDGLAKAIAAVRAVTPGRVITVFGCGGDRDPAKRPMMGEVAGELSDVVVVTSDNPRSEDPDAIIRQVRGGLEHARADLQKSGSSSRIRMWQGWDAGCT